ncbi:MAG TPA: selenocysteine-specific translation elongation factor [Stellaceae bacterium]
MIIGTAGHIDHGKTALVRKLTSIDPDRLPDEKRRGMTIDLGFAYRSHSAGTDEADAEILGFVDVPGHERFIHNMLAGVTGIDYVLLAVAADDGPMPQTREHLDIVSLLGVTRGVVALTKADLVDRHRLAEAEGEVRELLAGSTLENAVILPVSSVTGEGIAALEAQLVGAADAQRVREPQGEFRMAVDRSFVLPGIGLVVTGAVAAGHVAVGERAALTPSGIEVRVRSIHAHNRPVPEGRAGERCAVNLAGARVDRARVRRGDWLVAPALHAPRSRLDASLRLLPGEAPTAKAGLPVHLHLGAARIGARLTPLVVAPSETGAGLPVRLTLERPIGAWRGDRFILRDASASRTIGGGVVLDPDPPNRGPRHPQRFAALAALAHPQSAVALRELLDLSPSGVDLDRFALASGMTAAEITAACREAGACVLKAEGSHHGVALSPPHLAALRRDVVSSLATHHRSAPESPGPGLDQLRVTLTVRLPPPLFRALLETLVEERAIAIVGAAVRLPGHNAALPPSAAAIWARIRGRLDASGFEAVWVRDLASELSYPEDAMRLLMKRLARMGEVVEVAPDRFYRRQTVQEMAAMVAQMCCAAADGTVTAAAFRDRIATGRKLAIIILEFFDRTGVTIRRGDLRKINLNRVANE